MFRRLLRRQPLERMTSHRKLAEADLIARFANVHGYFADYADPQTFTEILSKRLIDLCRHGNPLFTRLTDKYAVRRYVTERVGERHLVPLIWHGTDPSLIPFDKLPPNYIIKVNHGCGGHSRVADGRVDRSAVRARLERMLVENYCSFAHEYQYRDIRPSVIIESIVDDGVDAGPITYRLFAFDGNVELIQADTETNSFYAFFDTSWNLLDLSYRAELTITPIDRPEPFETMLKIARKLSEGLDFVRVDLYASGAQVFVSEMTFTPLAGYLRFNDDRWDHRLGACWRTARSKIEQTSSERRPRNDRAA